MAYQVKETITNLTDTTYSSVNDFVAQCYLGGFSSPVIVDHWADMIDSAELGDAVKNNFLAAEDAADISYSAWNDSDQACIRTAIYRSEADYTLMQETATMVHKGKSQTRFSRVLISKGEV